MLTGTFAGRISSDLEKYRLLPAVPKIMSTLEIKYATLSC